MLEVVNFFTPFRMRLSRREPVQLRVELANKGKDDAMASLTINLGSQLSFEKGGYKTRATERISSLPPGEKKKFYYEIWPKQATRNGPVAVQIIASEHYQNFNYVVKEYRKDTELVIED